MKQYRITSADILGTDDPSTLTIPDAIIAEDDPLWGLIGKSNNPVTKHIQQSIEKIKKET